MTKAEIDAAITRVQNDLGHLKICEETFAIFEQRLKKLLPDIHHVTFEHLEGLDYVAKVYIRHPNVIFNGLVVV